MAESWRHDKAQMMRDSGVEPDPHQLRHLRMSPLLLSILMLWPRQTGKTKTLAVDALHTACFDPGDVVILAGEKQAQAFEVFDRTEAMHKELSKIGDLPALTRSGNELLFANGSRVLAEPSTVESIRGYTAKLVIIDEAAFTDDDVLGKVAPMLLTTRGRLICASTPNGARGWYYEAWENPGTIWTKSTVTIAEVPRITQEELDRQMGILGLFKYQQEIELKFIDGASQYFPTELIEAALCDDIVALFPDMAMAA